MFDTVLDAVNKYNMISQNDKVVLGLSGGADSVALLYILIRLKKIYNINILAVHINHNIRGEESIRDEKFVKSLCKNLNISIKIFNKNIKKISKLLKISEEEAGRICRYNCFKTVLIKNKFNKIAIAHNLNDTAETMLMRFFRGSGLKGLCGILPIRDNIIRPLIYCKREDIENFCYSNNIRYITDITNKDEKYTRNKIRLSVIPYIRKEFNKNIIESLGNTANILQEEEKYLDKETKIVYKKCVIVNDNIQELRLDILKLYDIVIVRRVIRLCCLNYYKNLYNISYQHINNIIELINNSTGKIINLPLKLNIEKSYNTLIFYKNCDIKKFEYKINIGDFFYVRELKSYISCGNSEILKKEGYTNTCTQVFNCDKIKNDIMLRSRRSGDKIYIKSVGGNKKIKDYFIDNKIQRYKRCNVVLLADGNNIIWIMDKLDITNDNYKTEAESGLNNIYIQLWEAIK